jgi:pyruvate formate lyase activating enzyme
MAEIAPSIPFIRGITVSGGECTLYPEFLRELGTLAHARGLTFFLDSNGNRDFADFPRLMEQVDAVMLDVKADPENPAEYQRVTGNSGETILPALNYLAKTGKLFELRTVVSPGLFDAEKLVEKICRVLAPLKPVYLCKPADNTEPRYKLIRYRPVGVRKEAAASLREPDNALMEKLAALCGEHGIKAELV